MSNQSIPALISRRSLLGGAAAVGAGAGLATLAAGVAQATPESEFAAMRQRWQTLSLGSDYDPADPDFAAALASIDQAALDARAVLDTSTNRTQVFTDVGLDDSAELNTTYTRLRAMAAAYTTVGSALAGDPDMVQEILSGLRTAHDLAYHDGIIQYGNWFHWEVSIPLQLTSTMVFLHEEMSAIDRADYLQALNYINNDPGLRYQAPHEDVPNRVPGVTSGSNLVYMCQNMIVRGVIGDDGDAIALGLDRLSSSLNFAQMDLENLGLGNDGLYPDGTFIQHRTLPLTGSYGSDFLVSISKIIGLVGTSSWSAAVPNVGHVHDSVENAFVPIIFNGHRMESVMGRAVTRRRDDRLAVSIIGGILELAAGMDPVTRTRWEGIVKGWLERNGETRSRLAQEPIPRLAMMKRVLSDPAVPALPEQPGFRVFPRGSRAVHRGDGGWAFAIASSSERVSHYEKLTGENQRGFHTSAGMTYLYLDGEPSTFADGYWPTANVYGHPGTTLDTRPIPNGGGDAMTPTNTWAGGASLQDRIGAVGHDLRVLDSQVRAIKSWFCLPEGIVALGAGITDSVAESDAHPVITTMEHRNLGADGAQTLTVDGQVQPTSTGWLDDFTGAGWVHLDGTGGWVLLDPESTLSAAREERTGAWSDLDVNGPTTPVTRQYVTLAFDHGLVPKDAGYGYFLLPGATAARTADEASDLSVTVVANTPTVQSIRQDRSGLVMANFFEAGSTGDLIADGACSVIAETTADAVTITVADPTQHRDRVRVRMMVAPWSSADADPTITVTRTGRTIMLTVDTSARDGLSHTAVLHR